MGAGGGETMTHQELIKRAERWLLNTKGCGFCFTELCSSIGEIPDAIGWKNCRSHLVECKTSRADFFSDKKKRFRRFPEQGLGVYRYYMTIPGLIVPGELPKMWGLLYVYKTQVRIIHMPGAFNIEKAARMELPILCSALRRIHLQGDLHKIYDTPWKN